MFVYKKLRVVEKLLENFNEKFCVVFNYYRSLLGSFISVFNVCFRIWKVDGKVKIEKGKKIKLCF